MTTITVQVPRSPAIPRGAVWAASAFAALWSLLRAAARMAPKRASTRAEEAEVVRRMAIRLQDTEPSLAADLFAAAARHEGVEE
jgi:hypothetical protein